jgi:hypothetical protein
VALALAIQEAIHLLNLLETSQLPIDNLNAHLMEDNQSTIFLANSPATTQRSKHIDIKLHFVREILAKGKVILHHCPTDKMVADILTKATQRIIFNKLSLQLLGVRENEYILIPEQTPSTTKTQQAAQVPTHSYINNID